MAQRAGNAGYPDYRSFLYFGERKLLRRFNQVVFDF